MHNAFFGFSYDGAHDNDDSRCHYYISGFVKFPFNGKFSAQVKTVGVVLSVDF